MNIRCPHCQTVFRVDPARIPDRGVRARCARCTGTFRVERPTAGNRSAGSGSRAVAQAAGGSGGDPARPDEAAPAWRGGRDAAAATAERGSRGDVRPAGEAPATLDAPGRRADPVSGPPAQPAAAGGRQRPTFGRTDPDSRAQRIARALVSDIVAYHRDKVEAAVRSGTLRTEFREEIMKSWEEYVAQVGLERAKRTPFFRDALNDVLARGQKVF
jgi:predicted Zn finger-like uncharacterized protein